MLRAFLSHTAYVPPFSRITICALPFSFVKRSTAGYVIFSPPYSFSVNCFNRFFLIRDQYSFAPAGILGSTIRR